MGRLHTSFSSVYFHIVGITLALLEVNRNQFSRSLGQRSMGLAVLVDDGSEMTSEMWDRRAFRKLVYLIPVVNLIVGSYEVARIFQRHTHQTNIDLSVGSIVAQADSLPPANRRHIR